jgi:hypothetical protein
LTKPIDFVVVDGNTDVDIDRITGYKKTKPTLNTSRALAVISLSKGGQEFPVECLGFVPENCNVAAKTQA